MPSVEPSVVPDPAQRAVIDLPVDASGVVIGAPGSGKTATIVRRVVSLIERGLRPEQILVLTPTRPAATALRDRLALGVGVATAGPLARSVAAFDTDGDGVVTGGTTQLYLDNGSSLDVTGDLLMNGTASTSGDSSGSWRLTLAVAD